MKLNSQESAHIKRRGTTDPDARGKRTLSLACQTLLDTDGVQLIVLSVLLIGNPGVQSAKYPDIGLFLVQQRTPDMLLVIVMTI